MSIAKHAPAPLILDLATEADTAALGQRLAEVARPGDAILLEGPIGAGKSCLARAFIQARLGRAEEVPSPTFTLVQVYQAKGGDIWHADLYRLTHPDEVWELGLDDAFETAICLVEWPDRLGRHVPQGALHIRLTAWGDGRRAEVSGGRVALIKAATHG
ncbi:tRNA (adenosine(37)-N6)-threonylcarbamoyltransferase complex ATPase subunit type 1 TsaE [Tabrizicola sp.]|uniref:tRNA (adenosine(37)-N6)-threonylcarbamoyltransferase complex ATPase subunit type 1 TsaE n=1 Tax=Tabrizicola sp. TaxID=2005166 RepID=UPI003F343125